METRDGTVYEARPAVHCTLNCGVCGFNPKEQKRRLKSGSWVQVGKVRTLVFSPKEKAL